MEVHPNAIASRHDPCPFTGGVPLGGLGTGTVELRADGSFREWQIFNNWGNSPSLDVFRYFESTDLLNALLLVAADGHGRVLETNPPADLPGVDAVEYEGKFPFARLRYRFDPSRRLSVELLAFSPFIPFHPERSGIPAFALEFTLRNQSSRPTDVSLAVSMVNPFGERCSASFVPDGHSVLTSSRGTSSLAILSPADDGNEIVLGGADDETSLRHLWSVLLGQEPSSKDTVEATGVRIAALKHMRIRPRETKMVRFIVGWYFPDHRENGSGPLVGHRYQEWFTSAADVARALWYDFDDLKNDSARWCDTLSQSSWPPWVNHWLVNIQANLAKSSWWVRDGRFVLYESFQCPNGGPVHIIDLADWPLLDLFGELELGLLKRFARDQHNDGRLAEQYCISGSEAKERGFRLIPSITFPGGRDLVDLSPKYAFAVYHRYRQTADREFLEAVYPSVKMAIRYAKRFDNKGVGLPSGGSIKTTWDHWDNGYIPSYAASMWLAGLAAASQLANATGDSEFEFETTSMLESGKVSMETLLWNGEYYAFFAEEGGGQNPLVFVEQIYGQLAGELAGLTFLPEDHVLSSLRAIARCNATAHGLVCLANPEGQMVRYLDDQRCEITICHMLPAVMALVAHGDEKEGMSILERVYDLLTKRHPGGLWNAPHHVLTASGDRNPQDFAHYLRDQYLWGLLKILSGWDYDATEERISLGPRLNPLSSSGPWIVPGAYGVFGQVATSTEQQTTIEVREGLVRVSEVWLRLVVRSPTEAKVFVEGKPAAAEYVPMETEVGLKLDSPVTLARGQRLEIVVSAAAAGRQEKETR
jgi:uncharacterized protein (DUF608 family)